MNYASMLGMAFSVAALLGTTAFAQETADRIWSGGPILTMDDSAPRAEAIAEKDGRILAVGSASDVMQHQGDVTEMIELDGRALIPGFVDAHGHLFGIGVQAMSANMLPAPDGRVNDIASMQDVLREWMEVNEGVIESINLIVGFGYDDAQLAEGRHPTAAELDEVSSDIPLIVIHQSGHLATMNTVGLEFIGVTADTEDPPGGVIRRIEGTNEPNGVLEEIAFLVPFGTKLLPSMIAAGGPEVYNAGAELAASFGYTTAQEGRMAPAMIPLAEGVAEAGGFKIDVVGYGDILADRDFVTANQSDEYVNNFRLAGAKITIDGSPQGFTALRDRPYYDPPENLGPLYSGYTAITPQDVIDGVGWAFENDIQVLVHSNGEGASDIYIAALELAYQAHGGEDRRPVLIHGQFLREDQVDSFQELGVFPSLFPMHTFYWGDWHRERTVGPVNAENISPTGWVLERGMMFSSHHDAPVAFPDSMRVLDATVTRRSRSGDIIGPHHRVDVMTGLKSLTLWPAFQHFEEDRKGSLEVGKLADFVILSDDPTAIDPETLDQLAVTETIKEGETVYLATQDEGNLRLRPTRKGIDPFANFLQRAAVVMDQMDQPPAFSSRRPTGFQLSIPHGNACAARTLYRPFDLASLELIPRK